jgi:anoctamin-10
MLPPAEKSPVLLLKWSGKALKNNESIIPMVKKEIEKGGLILVPNPARDTLLLTATQQALEAQAELDGLIMERTISVENNKKKISIDDDDEVIMDYFSVAKKDLFCKRSNLNSNTLSNRDSYGLFTAHHRSHLVMGILEQISIQNSKLLAVLTESNLNDDTDSNGANTISTLKHLLQSHEWMEVLTPLHVDDQKATVKKAMWWPFYQVMPPVDQIQDYYGPAVAYYFAFIGVLGRWVGMLGIVGTGSALFRLYRGDTIDEDEYTPFYGLICFLWSILFLRAWERTENVLAYKWGTLPITNVIDDFDQDYTRENGAHLHRRPEFTGCTRTSPVTGKPELYYPGYRRKIQYLVSAVVTAFMLGVAFLGMILSLNLQGYIVPKKAYHPFYYASFALLADEGGFFDSKSDWKCYIPVVLHAVGILTLNTIYRKVARKLTDWENHMTQTDYDNSMILKRFLFEAFDCYIALFYLAFYERDVDRLRAELIAVFYIDIVRRVGTEVLLPMILHYRTEADIEHPHDLHLDEYESFDDYMEILIAFGYVTLFASAYPFASMVMFISIWVEIRSDCYKLSFLCQKPSGERISDIGMWKRVLEFMVWFSCLTNCMLFGFTSDQMMHYLPDFYIRDSEGQTHMVNDKGWIAILIIFGLERVLIYSGLALHAMIPAMPESLAMTLKRRQFLLAQESTKTKSD